MIPECSGERQTHRNLGRGAENMMVSFPPPHSPPSPPPPPASLCRSDSPGKLLQYLVEDGCHIDANKPYAEIEVMKMVTNLYTRQAGT